MKKQFISKLDLPALRRVSAGAMLCCAVAGLSASAPLLAKPARADRADAADTGDQAALNFVGADIESVIKAVGHYTNITFVIDPRVKGTLTLVSEKSISKSQAFQLLTSALRLQGFAVVSADGYTKVVPEAEAKLQSGPIQVGSAPTGIKGDQVVSQVFHLNFEAAANVVTVLRPLISPNNTINANPGNNTVVITDYADNLNRLAKIIAALDAPAASDVDVIPVRYAIASDLASLVNKLLEPGGGAGAAGVGADRLSVMADPRTNALLLRAPSLARANLAKSLIAKLDQPTAQPGNVHVVYLKNAEAVKLAQTLRAVVSNDASANSQQGGGGTGNNSGGANGLGSSNGGNGQSGANGGGAQSGTGIGGGATNPLLNASSSGQQNSAGGSGSAGFIQADASTNSLIITAPESVYRNLRVVIDQLDQRRAEVYIEALIVEVTSDKASEFGVQWLGASGSSSSNYRIGTLQSFSTGGTNNSLTALATGKGAVLPGDGLSIGVFNKIGLGAIAHSLESDGNTNILSTPNLITLDNEVATIRVGQNVPILTGQFTSTAGTATNPFQTIDRKDVGLTLKVRPQISEGGTIKMAIYHETSTVDQSTLNATAGITLNSRVIENNVVADDGQIIVLGGLIQDSTGDNVDKVRGLADLPIIGGLFKYQKRSRSKTNLMVFLRPVIVRTKEQSTSLSADRYDYMRGMQQADQPENSALVTNFGQPLLPALANGQPLGATVARPLPPAPQPLPSQAPGEALPSTPTPSAIEH
ncbi:type II secretion system secretin GspD [Rugamonas sp.]|uniref:type II secretion system secretin GspD n=1 Tax=Rugamonas sp. TaxID=1926287 RepID=UPI0025DF1B90|nr:type II secretion system secretin GspD [Rugamonas sp.]